MKNQPIVSLNVYYTLIIAQLVLPVLATAIDMFSTDPELRLLDRTLYIEPQAWEGIFIAIVAMTVLVITFGLFFRKDWARKAYLYTFFPAFLVYFMPYLHWFYMSSFAAIFNDLAFVCSGVLLMIFVTPALYEPIFEKD
ncbi:hypothetical protein [Acinetobacter sp. P8-3-8]|uniref:hypothetical protein n=1 Tax=Acinetobacter sp. P8-3-8 TaxID=1029823 RepID=UPI0002486578|nr:hypothetical protein [Acinetobacter sp. P8-3-8]